jgi:hypothetical protein
MLKMSPNLRKPIQPTEGRTPAEVADASLQQVMDALTSVLAGGGDVPGASSDGSL